ncbi:other/TBCK protein kinase [Aphelenchoides avenae]|nr:other/TBCK protein kinase [Aphelenchus avenae]
MFGTNIEFGATTLIGCDECGRTCGNGLPVTPAPTRMLSRFTQLAALDHPNLCKYVELVRCQTAVNAVTLVSEHFTNFVWSALAKNDKRSDMGFMTEVAHQTAEAIAYCHRNRIVIGYITADSILLAEEKDPRIKLCQYGLYHVSGHNADVEYVLGSPWHLAPERIAQLRDRCPATFKSDVWAFGMVLLELATGIRLSEVWRVRQILSVLSSVIRKANNGSVLTPLLDAIRIARPEELTIPAQLAPVIERCLQVLPSQRPSADELVQLLESTEKSGGALIAEENGIDESIEAIKARIKAMGVRNECFNRPLRELFFLWKLCGSTVESILIKRGIIRMKPPVRTVPSLAVGDFQMLGNEEGRKFNTTFDVCVLPSSNLKERLSSIATEVLCHSFELERILGRTRAPALDDQTVIVKERDIDYQVTRMRILSKLLLAYPYKSELLREECQKDIPPTYRGEIWAALLDVTERTAQEEFLRLDITTEQASDRQLQVDIPRCHQYDELMTSPAAHYKLKHLLKAWLASEADHYVYWQGLDSLAAPFLVLHFNNLLVDMSADLDLHVDMDIPVGQMSIAH